MSGGSFARRELIAERKRSDIAPACECSDNEVGLKSRLKTFHHQTNMLILFGIIFVSKYYSLHLLLIFKEADFQKKKKGYLVFLLASQTIESIAHCSG
jgi:hypothetical protein